MPTPKSPVGSLGHVLHYDHPQFLALTSLVPDLESQVQTLLEASRVAIDSVNARESTVAARLRNIPAHVKEVAGHGVHVGAARAIAVVFTMSGADFRQWEPVFPEWGVAREDLDELVDDLRFVADAIVDDVSLDGVVSNIFGKESD